MLTIEIRTPNTYSLSLGEIKYVVLLKENFEYHSSHGKKIQLCLSILNKEFLKNNRIKYI